MKNIIKINTEREHIFSPDIHVAMSATINKSIEKKDVQKIVADICHRHPLLNSTIIFDKSHAAYYKLNSSQPIEICFLENSVDSKWKEWVTTSNKTPFDFEHGPLLRMLVETSALSTTITILGHHMLGDGKSFFYLMRDLLLSFDSRLDKTVLMPPIIKNKAAFPIKSRLGFLPRLFAKKLNYDYKRSGKKFLYSDYIHMYENYNQQKKLELLTFSLNEQETRMIIANCNKNNITVNEAITTAFFAARKSLNVHSDYIGVSCDIRKDIIPNPKESMGNFVSGISINARYDSSIDFWKNVHKMKKNLNAKLKNIKKRFIGLELLDALDDSLIDAMNFSGFGNCKNKTAQKLCNVLCGVPADEGLGISNLGKFNCKFKSFSLMEIHFVPPLFACNDFIVGVFTVNERMYFCLRYAAAETSVSKAANIFNKSKSYLLS